MTSKQECYNSSKTVQVVIYHEVLHQKKIILSSSPILTCILKSCEYSE